MADHGRNAGTAEARSTEGTETPAAFTTALQQLQFRGGLEQATERLRRNFAVPSQLPFSAGPRSQPFKQLQLDAGREDLGIDEAGGDVEQLPRASARNPAGRRKSQDCPMKRRRAQQAVTPGEQPLGSGRGE